jgi:hypothetical protein
LPNGCTYVQYSANSVVALALPEPPLHQSTEMTHTVNGDTYYHINSKANASPYQLMSNGQTVITGQQSNPFFRYYETYRRTFPVKHGDQMLQLGPMNFLWRAKNGEIKGGNIASTAHAAANHFFILARELFLENVRQAEFTSAPCRQRCIWLTSSLMAANKWVEELRFQPGAYTIVEVRATGQALLTDAAYLPNADEPLENWLEKARLYWSGEHTQHPLLETLFEGQLEVVEVMSIWL